MYMRFLHCLFFFRHHHHHHHHHHPTRLLISFLAFLLLLLLLLFYFATSRFTPQDCSAGPWNCVGGRLLSNVQHADPPLPPSSRRTKHSNGAISTNLLQKQESPPVIPPRVIVHAAITFNDTVLLIFGGPTLDDVMMEQGAGLGIQGARQVQGHGRRRRRSSSSSNSSIKCSYQYAGGQVRTPALSVEDGFVRCAHPPDVGGAVRMGSPVTFEIDGRPVAIATANNGSSGATRYGKVGWKKIVYGWASLENEGAIILFVKGISHGKRSALPDGLGCLFGDETMTRVVAFCQENVRCQLPPVPRTSELVGKRITVVLKGKIFPSVVMFEPGQSMLRPHGNPPKALYLCACTLMWNAAKFLKEWVMYHSHLGIQKFFIYDNNSDDDIKNVIEELNKKAYNVGRHPWPWLKTQEASFSHCAVKASRECTWVAFIDVDEFIFPKAYISHQKQERNPLHVMMKHYENANGVDLGQIKISNFNFGPSGLTRLPKSGQMWNYIWRMRNPRRVKSIVKLTSIDLSYCSRVHHFELKSGFVSLQASRNDAVIHHYKFQVWEDFKIKFVRRAATFVTDWGKNKDLDSFDRTPGLGTEAIEPPGWAHQFCEVEDTGLRDYVSNASQLHFGGKLIWE